MDRAVGHLVGLPGAAWHHHDTRPGELGQRGLGDRLQAAGVGRHRAGVLGDEDHPGVREPAEHFVRPDGVKRGEAVKQQDRDVHESPRLVVAGQVAGAETAQAIQLGIEYDPQPPYDAGSPGKAPAAVTAAHRARSRFSLTGQP